MQCAASRAAKRSRIRPGGAIRTGRASGTARMTCTHIASEVMIEIERGSGKRPTTRPDRSRIRGLTSERGRPDGNERARPDALAASAGQPSRLLAQRRARFQPGRRNSFSTQLAALALLSLKFGATCT